MLSGLSALPRSVRMQSSRLLARALVCGAQDADDDDDDDDIMSEGEEMAMQVNRGRRQQVLSAHDAGEGRYCCAERDPALLL